MGSGLEGFDFSHEGVKRVVGLLAGFVHAIASAPREFLYLSYLEINEHMIQKKKRKKKKRKKRKSGRHMNEGYKLAQQS